MGCKKFQQKIKLPPVEIEPTTLTILRFGLGSFLESLEVLKIRADNHMST